MAGCDRVSVHDEHELSVAYFSDAVDIFKFGIDSKDIQFAEDIIVFGRADIRLIDRFQNIAADRAGRAVRDIQHTLPDRPPDRISRADHRHCAEKDTGDQDDPLNHQNDLGGKLVFRRHEALTPVYIYHLTQ